MEEKNTKTYVTEENYILVSESRIKNTIKEHKKGQPFGWILSSSFACMVSFFTAFASYPSYENIWKMIFLVLVIVSSAVFFAFGVVTLVRIKNGKGTEKWFLEELKDSHPSKENRVLDFIIDVEPKTIFNIVNIILIIGVPVAVLLIVLGCNSWNLSNKEWSNTFWVLWGVGSFCSLIFGTYINAYFAYLLFGFDDGFPDISLF